MPDSLGKRTSSNRNTGKRLEDFLFPGDELINSITQRMCKATLEQIEFPFGQGTPSGRGRGPLWASGANQWMDFRSTRPNPVGQPISTSQVVSWRSTPLNPRRA